jgi:outer membrane protein assembly factor BamB
MRLWPGVAIAVMLMLARFVLPVVKPDAGGFAILGGVAGAVLIVLWWLFFSRAPWMERVGAVALMIVAIFVTLPIVHESIRGGMMGMMLPISAVPVMAVALVAWAAGTHRLATAPRRIALVATILLSCGVWTVLRTDGITGTGLSQLAWRWSETHEQQLLRANDTVLDSVRSAPPTLPAVPETETPKALPGVTNGNAAAPSAPEAVNEESDPTTNDSADWPGFRGPGRDGIIPGVRIKSDWASSPPVEMWRRAVGPGWSSFAVRGDLLYTQEQRGEDEMVACYKVSTGEPVWQHRDPVRFWESNGGAGPRGTPSLSNGRVYTFGATGVLNALDARTGAVVWSRNVASETNTAVPGWGFASSPLIVDDLVIVAADATLVAYDVATGHRRWVGPTHVGSYSSPHRTTIKGIPQVLLLGGVGATSIAPADGTVLWEYSWQGGAIVQPAVTMEGDILINTLGGSGGNGVRRIAAAHGPAGWTVEERWTSNGLKPFFNDFVVHEGHAFGFDGSILASIDLADGKRKWKGGRYGNGQLVLLPDQDLLLVISEEGELALVGATSDQFRELARFRVLDGKTWNHPALVGDVLLVRNGQEMAAFRLSLADR